MTKATVEKVGVEEEGPAQDYLMWTGSCFYPTVDDYIREAKASGCCRRIGKAPTTLEFDQSRVFLAHDDGLVGDGFVFGYFVVDRLEILVNFIEDVPEHLLDVVTPVYLETLEEPERDCGTRDQVGALYLMGSFVGTDEVRRLERFDPGRKHFRGALRIDYGDRLVEPKYKVDSMVAPSRVSAKKLAGKTPPKGWTSEQDSALLKRYEKGLAKGYSVARIAQEVTLKTGRSKATVIYRYNALCRMIEEDIDGEDSE